MGFSRQKYWSGLPCPSRSPSPALQVDSLPAEPPGKPSNTGVGSLSLLQWIFPTQGSNWGLLHCRRILYQLSYREAQKLKLEWVAMPSSRGSSQPRDWMQVFHIAGGFFIVGATREAQEYCSGLPCPPPGDLPDPGIEPRSPALQMDSLLSEPLGKPIINIVVANRWISPLISWHSSMYIHMDSYFTSDQIRSDQSLSCVRLFVTPWITACQASLSITNSQISLRLTFIESVMPSHPLSSPSPLAPNPSQHQSLFQWVNSSHEVAKELEFQL